jgi:hypothetical protein
MTVEQLINYLGTLPQDSIVQCLAEKNRGYETYTTWEDLEIKDHINICGRYIEIGDR